MPKYANPANVVFIIFSSQIRRSEASWVTGLLTIIALARKG
jgi:hypothetical protein